MFSYIGTFRVLMPGSKMMFFYSFFFESYVKLHFRHWWQKRALVEQKIEYERRDKSKLTAHFAVFGPSTVRSKQKHKKTVSFQFEKFAST